MKRRELTTDEAAECNRLNTAWVTYKANNPGATQAWLAAESGIGTQGAVGQYLRGVIPLNLEALLAICKVIGVEPEKISSRLSNKITPLQQQLVPKAVLGLRSVHPGNDESMTAIRKINVQAAASLHNHAYDQTEPEISPLLIDASVLSKLCVNPKHVMAMDIKGPSMEPTLFSGDTIIIDTSSRTPKAGDIFVVNFNGQVVVKRFTKKFNEWFLTSDNPDKQSHPDELCRNASAVIIGKFLLKQSTRADLTTSAKSHLVRHYDEHTQAVIEMMQDADADGKMRARLAVKDVLEELRQRSLNAKLADIVPASLKNDPDFIKKLESLLHADGEKKEEEPPF